MIRLVLGCEGENAVMSCRKQMAAHFFIALFYFYYFSL
jgi:hypothetical protein